MAFSAVPPHTFSLNVPATAHIVRNVAPQGATKRPEDDAIIRAVAAACNTTPQAFADALQAGGKSMLAICQQTTPTMTVVRLVDALVAPFKATLDAKVASGILTSAEEANDLANLRMKLTHMVADSPGTAAGSKNP